MTELVYKNEQINSIKRSAPTSAKTFFMFMMFMWVAMVSPLTGFNFGSNPILMPVYLLILIYFLATYCRGTYKPLLYMVGLFFVWYAAVCVKYGEIQKFSFPPIYSIIIAHIAYNIFERDEFLLYFERTLVKFSLISLIVWFLANTLRDPFVSLMHSIAIVENQPPTETYSFLFGLGSSYEMGLRRNIGFTWEPGKFSCWVLLGLYFNLVRKKFVIKPRLNKNFWILTLTLLTTLSTTGYAVFFLLLLFLFLNKKSANSKLIIIVLGILAIPSILGLSFMAEKIIHLTDLDVGTNAIEYHSQNGAEVVCPQRFTGLFFSIQNFINDKWLGFNQLNQSYSSAVLFKDVIVAPSEGIVGIFAQYGIFMGLFFYYWLFKSSKMIQETFQYKGKYMFAIFFIVISFSYSFWEDCILMSIYLWAYYYQISPAYYRLSFQSR